MGAIRLGAAKKLTLKNRRASALSVIAPCAAAAFVSGCAPEQAIPDGTWKVTVSTRTDDSGALDGDCIAAGEQVAVFNQSYNYELFFDGDAVQVDIDGQSFAQGTRAACNLSYESAIWLDERNGFEVTWRIEGVAIYQGAGGGCEDRLEPGSDWTGVEDVVVVSSADESIPVGCTYGLDTVGTWVSGG